MPSSSASAAPLHIGLEPSRFDAVLLIVGIIAAGLALAVVSWPIALRLAGAGLVAVLALQAWLVLQRRPAALLLYADGDVAVRPKPDASRPWPLPQELGASRPSPSSPQREPNPSASRLEWEPAELLQAAWFGPIPHLQFRSRVVPNHASGPVESAPPDLRTRNKTHAVALFPDRLGRDARHALRVWLATHHSNGAKNPERVSGTAA